MKVLRVLKYCGIGAVLRVRSVDSCLGEKWVVGETLVLGLGVLVVGNINKCARRRCKKEEF